MICPIHGEVHREKVHFLGGLYCGFCVKDLLDKHFTDYNKVNE